MLKPFFMLSGLLFVGLNFVGAHAMDLCSQDNVASCPLTLSDPTPVIPGSVACDAPPFNETYTVTSHVSSTVPFNSFDIIALTGDDAFSEVSVTGGTCVTAGSVPGFGTCTVIVTITPQCSATAEIQNASFPQTINRNLVIEPKSNQDLIKNINLQVTLTASEYSIIVSGEQTIPTDGKQAPTEEPFLAVHTSKDIWETANASGLAANAVFNSSTCYDGDCIAVGEIDSAITQPFVYYSINGGLDWRTSSVSVPVSGGGRLQGVACNGNQCSAVGKTLPGGASSSVAVAQAVEYVTTDGGATWSTPYTSDELDLSVDSDIQTVSCGNDCIATGTGLEAIPDSLNSKGQQAFIVTSGAAEIAFFNNILFFDSACSGDTCIAVGLDNNSSDTKPFITRSNDLWVDQTPYPNPDYNFTDTDAVINSNFYGASCTNANSKIVCMVVGGVPGALGPDTPLVYLNTDTANSNDWSNITPANIDSVLSGVSCVTIDNAAICTVVGSKSSNAAPVLLEWVNSTWSVNQAGSDPVILTSVACTQSASNTAVCAAAGGAVILPNSLPPYLAPFLWVNTDVGGSGSWQVPSTNPALPTQACFSNAGADGTNSGVFLALDKDSICHFLNGEIKGQYL